MPNLTDMLRDSEESVLHTIAQIWGVAIKGKDADGQRRALDEALRQADRAVAVYEALDDKARGALQMLAANGKLAMPQTQFERLFGKIRKMGIALVEKEQPHRKPSSAAEALFYRGLIAETSVKKGNGIHIHVYIADELAQTLPLKNTSYSKLSAEIVANSAALPAEAATLGLEPLDPDDIENKQKADTTLVDDMATVLAYLRIHGAQIEGDSFLPIEIERIQPYLLKPDVARLNFLLCLGIGAELIVAQDGRAHARRDGLQKWLGLPRHEQVAQLAETWRTSRIYQELWHIPDLYPDDNGIQYDPLAVRHVLVTSLRDALPAGTNIWFGVDDVIAYVKAKAPDFQRSNYDSWYIRNRAGDYLRGFESWEAVEGALLEFVLLAPLHWLGLADVDSDGDAVSLNTYGKAFVMQQPFPGRAQAEEKISVNEDGTLYVSRNVSRLDRFQVARFTTWLRDHTPYTYKFDANGIKQAAEQGIHTAQIEAFLRRHSDKLPEYYARLLAVPQGGDLTHLSLERLLVMRATSQEVLDRIAETPAYRRYLGARLGPLACVVRPEGAEALAQALAEIGITVEFIGD